MANNQREVQLGRKGKMFLGTIFFFQLPQIWVVKLQAPFYIQQKRNEQGCTLAQMTSFQAQLFVPRTSKYFVQSSLDPWLHGWMFNFIQSVVIFFRLMQIGNSKGEVVRFFKKVIVILVKRGPQKITSLLFYKKLSNFSFDLNWWQQSNRNSLMIGEMISITPSKTYVVEDSFKNMAHLMK